MSLYDHVLASSLGSAAAVLLLVTSSGHHSEETGRRLSLQAGPIALEIGGPALVRLGARTDCLSQGCPLLQASFERLPAPQGPPREARRVQTCETRGLERGWFIAKRADEGLGEQGRVCETASPETA